MQLINGKKNRKPMKIIYCSPSAIPSKTAHSIYSVKMAEALAANGHEVFFIGRKNSNEIIDTKDIERFYNVSINFKIKLISYPKFKGSKIINSLVIVRWLFFQKQDVIISSDLNIAIYSAVAGLKVIYDAHGYSPGKNTYEKRLIKRFYKSKNLVKVAVVTNSLKELYLKKGIPQEKVFVVRNGTNEVKDLFSKKDLFNNGHFKVGYVGHLYKGKGMELIASVADKLRDIDFHIVGGDDEDIVYWKNTLQLRNIIFHGFVTQTELSEYINTFDICLLPNQTSVEGSGRRDIGGITCPLKMFDYMAHKKPIIASDLPVLREVLNDEMAIFCDPINSQEWMEAILKLEKDECLRKNLSANAYQVFKNHYTWKKRAEEFIKSFFDNRP
jgi:glycosyltransferase involved in cell wall biosynthesis